jgi:phosphoglycolate phosphatase
MDSIGVLFGYGSREEMEAEGVTYICETAEDLRNLLARL